MSSTPNQSRAFTCSSRPARLSAEHKRMKHLTRKQLNSLRRDSRVNIGLAFQSWCALKESHGFTSDAEVALHLLNETKALPPMSGPAEASNMTLKISQSEVQALIEQEVHKAVANKERQIESIIQHLQDTNDEASFETSIQKLENRIDAIARRAEVALSHLANIQKQSSSSSAGNTDILREGPEHDPVETMSQIDTKRMNCEAKSGELLKMMETTRNALKNFHSDHEVLTTAMAELDPEESPPVLTPWGSPVSKKVATIKTETTHFQNEDDDDEKQKHFEEPMAKRLKKDDSSPGHSSSPAPKEMESMESVKDAEDMFFYPPLPNIPFPSILKMEAASYSMPPRVDVNLAFIRNPTRISVLWNVEEEDPSAPPMESYTIFLTMETFKGSGVFLKWDTYDKLQAKSLPMCALINKYKRGHRLCAAVVGKDVFGRYGPYSKVATAILPD
ncbi:uncharacterized protein atf7ip2 isoform 2-T2 [Anableps anableps]